MNDEIDRGGVLVHLIEYRERRRRATPAGPTCPAAARCRMSPLCRSWNQCLPRSPVLSPRTA
ncbi:MULTISPECIES: hypothetical protein [Catenuloplanes]|uniref:Uncharacterized protein n=1 Tax=Catenuloplanes niger TaxID=587534 RepID=A0AAE3ZHX7_9ACTN|nr:hypothetical protein [Catenuloplanes niger]MDR7320284.1 hypothetical protein [Catenuloplanes niger]